MSQESCNNQSFFNQICGGALIGLVIFAPLMVIGIALSGLFDKLESAGVIPVWPWPWWAWLTIVPIALTWMYLLAENRFIPGFAIFFIFAMMLAFSYMATEFYPYGPNAGLVPIGT